MTVLTTYNPAGTNTAGMSTIGVAPAVANIQAPTLAELNAGTVFQCATEEFGLSTKVKTTERKKLCMTTAQKRLGNSAYDDLELTLTMDDPQSATPQKMLTAFPKGATVYLFHRPGMKHTDPLASGQQVQVIKAIVANRDLKPITTDEGDEYQIVVTLMPQDATDLLVPIAA